MRRRRFIGAAGCALAAAAGCISGSDDTTRTDSEGNGPDDSTPTGTPAEDPLSDVGCPSFSDSADQTVCAHTDHDADVYPTVSDQVFVPTTDDDSVELLKIQLHNEGDSVFGLNPHEWALKRQTGDGWEHVAPEEYIEPWYNLAPGEAYTWTLSVETHPSPNGDRHTSITENLDAGTYAFQVTGIADPDSDNGTNIESVALFKLERD